VANPSVRRRLASSFHAQLTHTTPLLTVRKIENYATSSGDVPVDPITITDAGELSPSDPSLSAPAVVASSDGDPYEDYPEDNEDGTPEPSAVLEAARTLRALANARWKDGAAADALTKWQKALRYLDVHHDAPEELADEFVALRTPLLLNSALAALKAPGGVAGARVALDATNAALELPKLGDSDRGMYWLQSCTWEGSYYGSIVLPILHCSKGTVSSGSRPNHAQGIRRGREGDRAGTLASEG
jgi:hypothetical protein